MRRRIRRKQCSCLLRVKSRLQGRDYKLLDLDLVEAILSLQYLNDERTLSDHLDLNKICGDLESNYN